MRKMMLVLACIICIFCMDLYAENKPDFSIYLKTRIDPGSGTTNPGDTEPVVDGSGLKVYVFYDTAGAGSNSSTSLSGLTGVSSDETVNNQFDLTGNQSNAADNFYLYLVATSNVSTAVDTTIAFYSTDGWVYDGTSATSGAKTSLPLSFTTDFLSDGNLTTSKDESWTVPNTEESSSNNNSSAIKVHANANSQVLNPTIVSKTTVSWTPDLTLLAGSWTATITVDVAGV